MGQTPPVDLNRLRSLGDAIYAFSMTLLVTSLHLPALSQQEAAVHLFRALNADWRHFMAYTISFLIIGSYWMLHHSVYAKVHRVDMAFIWLNVLVLLSVTFLPFPTALMGQYGRHHDTAFVYGAAISLTYLLMNLVAWYAGRARLLRPGLSDDDFREFRWRLLVPFAFACIGTALSLFYTRLAFVFFDLMALVNLIPWTRMVRNRRNGAAA